jgi:hypothetical protein
MTTRRPALSRELRDAVLREFNHRCAICGRERPHIHHIDEDSSNNTEANLLPLCPNHHLSDQHDPTRRFDSDLLALFRRYKDPQILSPRFDPVFRRLKPLLKPDPAASHETLATQAADLSLFIQRFAMGDYYFSRLHQLLGWSEGPGPHTLEGREAAYAAQHKAFLARLSGNMPAVVALLVEQLRYQDWPPYAEA